MGNSFERLPGRESPASRNGTPQLPEEGVLYRAPEATPEGYEGVKGQFVARLDEAAGIMEKAELDEDAAYFRDLIQQMRDVETPLQKVPLWYFDKRVSKTGGRIFNDMGEGVMLYLNEKELSKYKREHDLKNHLVVPNYRPPSEAQRIILEHLGVEQPETVEKGHFNTTTQSVRGYYEQLGPAKNPHIAYFHFQGTPHKDTN